MDHSTHHLKPPSPLFPLPLPPFQTRVDKENASSESQDLRLYLRMQANRRCYSAHSTTNLDPRQLPRINETETISPIRNRLPSRALPSPRLPCSTEISRFAVSKTWLPKRRRGLCSGVKTTTSRGFCDAARGASSRSPDHGRCLCGLSARPTDRLDRCWTWSVCPVWKRVSMGGCNKGSVHTRKSELYYCILEWMTDRLWITFPFDPCWYLLSFWVITTSRNWSWQYLNLTSKMQIEKMRTFCNWNEKEQLTKITQHQPIAVSTEINLAYINHSLNLSTYELLLLSPMTFILKAHLRDHISLSLLSWTVPLPLGLDENVGLFECILVPWNIKERILGTHFKELSSLNFHKK
jgi:hypothetical protein